MRDHREFKSEELGHLSGIFRGLLGIVSFISLKNKVRLIFLLKLQFFSGFAEMISIGALLPFIAAITNSEELLQREEIKPALRYFDVSQGHELVVLMSALFLIIFIAANCLKLFTFWAQAKISVTIGNELASVFFRKVMYQDFSYHLNINSSLLISRIVVDLSTVLQFISHAMMISTQSLTVGAVVTAIVIFDPLISSIMFSTTIVLYLLAAKFNTKRIVKNGELQSTSNSKLVHGLQVSFGGIRDVILGNKYEHFISKFAQEDQKVRSAAARTQLLTILPRYFVETLVVSLLALIAAYYALKTEVYNNCCL